MTVPNGKSLRVAVVLENEVLVYLQRVLRSKPQGRVRPLFVNASLSVREGGAHVLEFSSRRKGFVPFRVDEEVPPAHEPLDAGFFLFGK